MIGRALLWWNGRSRREQILLGIMAALFLLVAGWLGLLRPLQDGLRSARLENRAATERLARVRADIVALRSERAAAADPAQAIVSRSASEAGFSPTRLDPGSENRVLVGLASAKPVALRKWLEALDAEGIFVEQISLRPNSDATLTVDATLRARAK